ncbi:hypothetical protein [Desulfobacter sp.]|uniref:hypothetical protein n=1 Tax=Desulfobacter sp. TaxID=2294 RepID=UPI00257A1A9C|nr:hypothetical protein [Desulfobacter sp.]
MLFVNQHIEKSGLGRNIGHSVGWVERSETQQLIGVGFRSSTQPTKNSDGLKYDQCQKSAFSTILYTFLDKESLFTLY